MKILFFVLFLYAANVFSEIQATVLLYEEKEQNTPSTNMRYIVTENNMRIDNGQPGDDYILYDRNPKKIFSINHNDKTILVIKDNHWVKQRFKFKTEVMRKKLDQAPKISGQILIDYWVKANDEVCSRFQLLPETFKKEMKVFYEYQKILSGQQVKSINHTPIEMQTPCFLIDQIYNDGAYYLEGLPVQEWHSRGYAKILKDFKHEEVSQELFLLPEGYKEYSIN